ncbi:MAG: hypothetical protein AB7S26_28980 [Sandaracinaceae bacterium]
MVPAIASAQDDATRERARALVAEAQAHEDGGRWVLAAQTYQQLYDLMSQAGLPRASVALWTSGSDLARVPGREREASDTLRRFLAESSALASDPEIAGYRAEAPRLIAELEARVGPSDANSLSDPQETPASSEPETRISPIGPVILGVGGAGLIAGLIVGAVSLSLDAQFRADCENLAMCPTRLRPEYDEMRAYSTAADVLMVASGIVAAGGLLLTLLLTEDLDEDAPVAGASCDFNGCFAIAQGSF